MPSTRCSIRRRGRLEPCTWVSGRFDDWSDIRRLRVSFLVGPRGCEY
jgi:hypothetical protein